MATLCIIHTTTVPGEHTWDWEIVAGNVACTECGRRRQCGALRRAGVVPYANGLVSKRICRACVEVAILAGQTLPAA